MSANGVQFNVATQLDKRYNLSDCVGRYITFCNVLTGHFTRMHNACKLLSLSHKKLQIVPPYEHYESSQRSCVRYLHHTQFTQLYK